MISPPILNLGHIDTATFSPCGQYRYTLYRQWPMLDGEERQGIGKDRAYAMFIGLNPSTADEVKDDPTVRRCRAFAKSWGYGAMFLLNLFAFRATKPRVLLGVFDPVGQDNDEWLFHVGAKACVKVAAWGTYGDYLNRARIVSASLGGLMCLSTTKDGHPRHPLYVSAKQRLEPWQARP